jgi:hypothetical protein
LLCAAAFEAVAGGCGGGLVVLEDHASISTMREYEANALLTTTRMRSVVSTGK